MSDKLWGKDGGGFDSAFSGTSLTIRCYESHPILKVGKGQLCGGNCYTPSVKDADVYVVLNKGDMGGRQSDPWEAQKVVEIQYAISDMHAPTNVPRFKKLVTWLCTQLQDGKKVHVGCMGGHGRTGTVLAAIVAEMGKKDAINYVRKHYCKKAVESKEQVDFLAKHYGVVPAAGTKTYFASTSQQAPRGTHSTSLIASTPYSTRVAETMAEMSKAPKLVKDVLAGARVVKVEKVRKGVPTPKGASKSFGPMASSRSLWNQRSKG